MSYTTIAVSASDNRGNIFLNRPEKLNAINRDMHHDLIRAAAWFDTQPEVKVVVISGSGRAFSAGADIASFEDSTDGRSRGCSGLSR